MNQVISIPSIYSGKDVRLLYSKDNPRDLGYWMTNKYGHEKLTLAALKELGYSPQKIAALPTVYLQEN